MNKDEKKAEKRAAKRKGPPKKARSKDARLRRMEKETAQLHKDNQILVAANGQLRQDYVNSMASLAEETRQFRGSLSALFANDRSLANTNDGLADRYFGFVELLRSHGEPYAELLTEENLVKFANAYREDRLARAEAKKKEEAEAAAKAEEEAKQAAVKEEMGKPAGEQPEETPDIPDGGLEFGG